MVQNEIFKGNWRLPGSAHNCSGTLTYDPIEGAHLELHGAFAGTLPYSKTEIVHGQTLDGAITLLNVNWRNSTSSQPSGTAVTTYTVVYIFVGHLFDSIEEIRFREVSFTLFNLLEWVNATAVDQQSDQEHYKLDYNKPSPIPLACYDGCSGRIEFALSHSANFGLFDVTIKQRATIKLSYGEAKPYREIIEDSLTFQGLLTLCTYEQSYPLEIRLQDDALQETIGSGIRRRTIPRTIRLIYRSPFVNPAHKSRPFYQHLVKYEPIASSFQSILPKWFSVSKELEQSLDLLLRSFANKYDFTIEKFMDIAKAIELFHRQRFPNGILPNEEFKKRKKRFLLDDLTPEEKQWIQKIMEHGNEPTLFQRLQTLLDTYAFPYFDKRVPDREVCCRQAKDNRNYYTHYNKRLKKVALNGKELFDLTENLKLILLTAILNSIGIETAVFEESIQRLIY